MATENQRIAAVILEQLGGRQFVLLTGSNSFVAIPNGLTMRLARNSTQANVLKIVLTAEDLYDVEFKYVSVGKKGVIEKTIAKFDGLFFDQLQDTFEQTTGLYVTLKPRSNAA